MIEPTGCPTDPADVWPDPTETPFLAVYGDYVAERNQTGRLDACRTTATMVTNAGGVGEVLELTAQGVRGNSHVMMQDDNNHDIAAAIIAWLETHVDPPTGAGAVPGGLDVPGTPLRVNRETDGRLTLRWDADCDGDTIDYELYAGLLGAFDSHEPLTCTTEGELRHTFVPTSGNLFYLVVPRSPHREGSHGLASDGSARPTGAAPCLKQLVDDCN